MTIDGLCGLLLVGACYGAINVERGGPTHQEEFDGIAQQVKVGQI